MNILNKDVCGSKNVSLLEIFQKQDFGSSKYINYFPIYETLFEQKRGQSITFVEIGVQGGGSLGMWRSYFGSKARIIGIDLNPEVTVLTNQGFEIFIGDQSDPNFWSNFFSTVGPVDVVLDDGGHTYEQQISTVLNCLPHINKNGGLIVVEDAHTSFMKGFGYPSPYTFMEWSKRAVDSINKRYFENPNMNSKIESCVWSIRFFESIVCFEIKPPLCIKNTPEFNHKPAVTTQDYRHEELRRFARKILPSGDITKEDAKNRGYISLAKRFIFKKFMGILTWYENRKSKKFF